MGNALGGLRVVANVRSFRLLSISVIVAVVAWIAGCAAIGVIAVEGALHLPRLALNVEERDRAVAIAKKQNAILSEAKVTASDGSVLRAWSIRSENGNGSVVILLHGQGDNRAGMLGPAEMLLRHGYSVLLPDARGHGQSDGAITTYGVLEADDVRRWVEWLHMEQMPKCIDGIGDSMGGAELLRSLDTVQAFCAVIAESPFSTFREAAYDRLGQQFRKGAWIGGTLLKPVFYAGVFYARLRYRVDLEKADPARAVAGSTVPVMLIHGLADSNLPPRHSERIKAVSPRVMLWEPDGADHCGASMAAPIEYEKRVAEWLDEHQRH